MNLRALSILALASLAACGGGGGGGGGAYAPVATVAPAAAPVAAVETPAIAKVPPAPMPINTNCVTTADGHVSCDLMPNDQAIGIGVPAGTYVTFTNRTGAYLQVNQISAYTGEQANWSEFCADLNNPITGQSAPGVGEVACTTKNIGEDYLPLTFGNGTGLSVAPGGVLYVGSHTEPEAVSHTYSLMVQPQTTGLSSWRQPQQDTVINCNGQQQSTEWSPWKNTTTETLHVRGASIYAVSGTSTPNELSGHACLYVLNPDGSVRIQECNDALRTRGQADFSVDVAPGESVAAQATNACPAGNWDWVAYLRVW